MKNIRLIQGLIGSLAYFTVLSIPFSVNAIEYKKGVEETDWSFQALVSFIKKSNCLSRYPQYLSYLYEKPLSRYEFTVVLNTCFNGMDAVAAKKDPQRLIRDNLQTLRKLRDEFKLELSYLENNYFSNLRRASAKLFYTNYDNSISSASKLEGSNSIANDRLTSIDGSAFAPIASVRSFYSLVKRYDCFDEDPVNTRQFVAISQGRNLSLTRWELAHIMNM